MLNAMKSFVSTHTDRKHEYIFNVLDAQPVAGAVIWALEAYRNDTVCAGEKELIVKACQ
jgi:hypothetical protein